MYKLRKGVVITFLFTALAVGAAPVESYKATLAPAPQHVVTVAPSIDEPVEQEINVLELYAQKTLVDEQDMTVIAFDRMTERMPDAMVMAPVARFVTDGIGDIHAEKMAMDCDMRSKVLNVSYRLANNILLSVSKPLATLDDELVMFNLYHGRNLLVSDSTNVKLLAQYILKVEERIGHLGLK